MLGIGTIVSAITGLIGSWLETRKVKAEGAIQLEHSKTNAKIRAIERAEDAHIQWDNLMAEGSKDSWKDEFWTLFLSIPLVLLFWPDPDIQAIAKRGFQNLKEAPEWYVAAVMLAIASAFGYRKFVRPFMNKR